MQDKIQKLIAEIIGDGFTVEVKPIASGNVSSDFGAGVTTYLSVYTDSEGFQAIYVNGELEFYEYAVDGPDVVRVADGRLVRMRSAVLSGSLDMWPGDESDLKDMIAGYQAGIDAGAAIGAPDRDGLVLLSEWNNERGCFEDSIVEPPADHIADANKMAPPTGYRLLKSAKVEPRIDGDLFWSLSSKKWLEVVPVCVEYANRDDWHACRKIETANPPVVPDSSVPDPGPGYRLLSKEPPEPVVRGDEFYQDFNGEWVESENWEREGGPQAPSYYYRRKIEPTEWIPKVGDKVRVVDGYLNPVGTVGFIEEMIEGITNAFIIKAEDGKCTMGYFTASDLELIEAATPQADRVPDVKVAIYRTPTQRDLANGPIRCRVRDSKESEWEILDLYAVLPERVKMRFVAMRETEFIATTWKYCEIPSDHQAIRVGDLVKVTARPLGVYREGWRHEMNRQVNKIAKVSGITDDGRFLLNGCGGWRFHRDWLELVETASATQKGGEA